MGLIKSWPADPHTGAPLSPMKVLGATRGYPVAPEDASPTVGDAPTDDPYPEDGNIEAVIEWVDRAPNEGLRSDRAKAATAAEHGRGKPRKTLLGQLAERTGQ